MGHAAISDLPITILFSSGGIKIFMANRAPENGIPYTVYRFPLTDVSPYSFQPLFDRKKLRSIRYSLFLAISLLSRKSNILNRQMFGC